MCYVYLEDLQPHDSAENRLVTCRWFTRGWTLQELIAPETLLLYDIAWNLKGTHSQFTDIISKATMIPSQVLEGRRALSDCSVAARMSWAARRETTRIEDIAYCLLGIFGINMPLMYGEGARAFRRLQEEIVKGNNDLTIFAWDFPPNHNQESHDLFASSPAVFASPFDVRSLNYNLADFPVTNKGILISNNAPLRTTRIRESNMESGVDWYVLHLGTDWFSSRYIGMYLRKMGPKSFCRDTRLPLAGLGGHERIADRVYEDTDYCILTSPFDTYSDTFLAFRHLAIHVPLHDVFVLVDAAPRTLWDITDRIFLSQEPFSYDRAIICAISLCGTIADTKVELIALCVTETNANVLACKLFLREEYGHLTEMILGEQRRREILYRADLKVQAPELLELGNSVNLGRGNELVVVTAIFLDEAIAIESIRREVAVQSVKFNITSSTQPDKRKAHQLDESC